MTVARSAPAWLFGAIAAVCAAAPPEARAKDAKAVLHEPIPPDAKDDARAVVRLDGDLPAAIRTPQGVISAPDPARSLGSSGNAGDKAPYAPVPGITAPDTTFAPDRDTRAPELTPYDDPFTPSTAPFKRLSAYDALDANYTLSVRDGRVSPLAVRSTAARNGEERFYADIVVELAAGRRIRIPSVGPGARVVRSRAGVGPRDVRFELYRDGADNWFVIGDHPERVRLVMELAISRDALGGPWGDPTWNELPRVAALPDNVAAAAAEVTAKIGVSHAERPREVVAKLTNYFRSFRESDAPIPSSRGDIYLDLALQKKGVCRHRAFAFFVTALSLGLPTRMIANETHAWVEVHDGKLYRRIDLGGAGQMTREENSSNTPYAAPPDPFAWPAGAAPTDANGRSRPAASGPTPGALASAAPTTSSSGPPQGPVGLEDTDPGGAVSSAASARSAQPVPSASSPAKTDEEGDDRATTQLSFAVLTPKPRRGSPIAIRGEASIREVGPLRGTKTVPCAHLPVVVALVGPRGTRVDVGQLATDQHGRFDGELMLPQAMTLGDYDVRAYTFGNTRCGPSRNR